MIPIWFFNWIFMWAMLVDSIVGILSLGFINLQFSTRFYIWIMTKMIEEQLKERG